jgi:hypothetical protein
MICEHRPVPLGDACVDALLFPHLRPETIRALLQRAAYSSVEEREAELLATLLLTRIGRGVADSTSTTDPQAREILRRLVSSFEDMGEGRPWARSSSATGRRC